jgi:hypothetical protein
MDELRSQWRDQIGTIFGGLGIAVPADTDDPRGREKHSDDFRWLWGEFTSVRRLDPVATW